MRILILLLLLLASDSTSALSVEEILKINNATSLKAQIQQRKNQDFLKRLCWKQKENNKTPTACYQLQKPADNWCLNLQTGDLNMEILKVTLESSFLSSSCRKHLKQKEKVLLYRRKDLLLKEINSLKSDKVP